MNFILYNVLLIVYFFYQNELKMKKFGFRLLMFVAISLVVTGFSSCTTKSDTEIQTALAEKAKNDSRLTGVTTIVTEGVVTIDGQCPDEPCKTEAENAVKEVEGVKSVVNNITISNNLGEPMNSTEISSDSALTNKVKDAVVDFPTVNATVANGEITLTGSIQREKLPGLMQSLNSLNPKKINNELTVQ